jgi:hypothetical protein
MVSEQAAAHRLGVVQAILGDADGAGVEVAAHHAALELAELREDADSAAAQIGEVRRILGARDDEGAKGAARRVMRDHAAEVASLRAERDVLRGDGQRAKQGDVIAIDETRDRDRRADRVWLVAVVAILALGVGVAALLRWVS